MGWIGCPLTVLRGHQNPVTCFDSIPSLAWLISGDDAGLLVLWDLNTRRPLLKWTVHAVQIVSVGHVLGPDVLQIFAQLRNGQVVACPVEINQPKNSEFKSVLRCGKHTFCKMSIFNAPRKALLILPADEPRGGLDLWDESSKTWLVTGMVPAKVQTGMCMCSKAVLVGDKIHVGAAYESGHVGVFVLDEHVPRSLLVQKVFDESAFCLDIHPSGLMVVGGAEQRIALLTNVFGANGGECPVKFIDIPYAGIADLCVQQDGMMFAVAGWDAKLRLFSTNTLEQAVTCSLHDDTISTVQSACFASGIQDPSRLLVRHHNVVISASRDGNISIWGFP